MFETDFPSIKKINVKTLNEMANRNNTFICIVCELYWAPCIDRLYEIQENLRGEQVYYLDPQRNTPFHIGFLSGYQYNHDIFGIFYPPDTIIDPKLDVPHYDLNDLLTFENVNVEGFMEVYESIVGDT